MYMHYLSWALRTQDPHGQTSQIVFFAPHTQLHVSRSDDRGLGPSSWAREVSFRPQLGLGLLTQVGLGWPDRLPRYEPRLGR